MANGFAIATSPVTQEEGLLVLCAETKNGLGHLALKGKAVHFAVCDDAEAGDFLQLDGFPDPAVGGMVVLAASRRQQVIRAQETADGFGAGVDYDSSC